jgi:hypothetical protein
MKPCSAQSGASCLSCESFPLAPNKRDTRNFVAILDKLEREQLDEHGGSDGKRSWGEETERVINQLHEGRR